MSDVRTVTIDEGRFETLVDIRRRVNETLARWNSSKEQAKSDGKTYEAARSEFEREFDRLVRAAHGEDLPLFANQSEAIEAAQSDPVVTKLVERLLARGHDVNTLIVFGYTKEERNLVARYLDALDMRQQLEDANEPNLPDVEVPIFLVPQPMTAVEVAYLITRLGDADHDVTPMTIDTWSQAQLAEVRHYLVGVECAKADKGDEVTFEDLPKVPAFLGIRVNSPTEIVGTFEPDEETAHDPVEDEPQPKNLPPPARGRKRRGMGGDQASA